MNNHWYRTNEYTIILKYEFVLPLEPVFGDDGPDGGDVLLRSPLKRRKRMEDITEKLTNHNVAFLGRAMQWLLLTLIGSGGGNWAIRRKN